MIVICSAYALGAAISATAAALLSGSGGWMALALYPLAGMFGYLYALLVVVARPAGGAEAAAGRVVP